MKRRTSKKVLLLVIAVSLMGIETTSVSAMLNEDGGLFSELGTESQTEEEFIQRIEADYETFLQEKEKRENKMEELSDTQEVMEKLPYDEVLLRTKEELTVDEAAQVDYAVQLSEEPKRAAEVINSYEDEVYQIAVKEILDDYFEDAENVKSEQIELFSDCIDERANSILECYEEALGERQNAKNLDYESEHVLIVFDKGMTYEDAKEITDCIGEVAIVLDGTGRTLEECIEDTSPQEDWELIVNLDIGISQTVSQAINTLDKIEGIDVVEQNGYAEPDGLEYVNDTYKTEQGYWEKINTLEAWDTLNASYNNDFAKTTVAVIDTGVDVEHEDLKNMLSKDSVTFENNNIATSLFECETPDSSGHGTGVAGVIAAETNNGVGMAGITSVYNPNKADVENWCEILALKATDKYGVFNNDYIISAIRYAIQHDADVINMSFGVQDYYRESEDIAIQNAHKAGIVLVASAGNMGTFYPHYPSCYDNVISVAALDASGNKRRADSNYGEKLDISAIGEGIPAPQLNSGTGIIYGKQTSFAAPQVTAAIALIHAVYPEIPLGMGEYILASTADRLSDTYWCSDTGYGRLNIGHAVQYVKIYKYLNSSVQDAEVKVTYNTLQKVKLSIEIPYLTEYFDIQRGEMNNGEIVYETIEENVGLDYLKDGKIVYEDTNLEYGKTYYYRVIDRVYGFYGGNYYAYTRNDKPDPVNICCQMGKMEIKSGYYDSDAHPIINFSYKGPYTYFVLMRSENENGEYRVITVTNQSSYIDTTVESVTNYYYKAYAMDSIDNVIYESEESNILHILTIKPLEN